MGMDCKKKTMVVKKYMEYGVEVPDQKGLEQRLCKRLSGT